MSKAHYLAAELEKVGMKRLHAGEFFHEFVTTCPDTEKVLRALDGRRDSRRPPGGGGHSLVRHRGGEPGGAGPGCVDHQGGAVRCD